MTDQEAVSLNRYRSSNPSAGLVLPAPTFSTSCFSLPKLPDLFITALETCTSKSSTMSDLFVDLEAPNGREYKQPIGLFINNEFVKSSSGEKITSINPTYALTSSTSEVFLGTDLPPAMKPK